MNLDDLMTVWRSQDAAPLHDLNKTLLHLALRQDEAKLQKHRRRARWLFYVSSVGVVAGMAAFLAIMIYPHDDDVLYAWDYAIPIVGAAAALLSARALYVNHRAQSVREQSYGESLRDQLSRSIAQLEGQILEARKTSVLVTVLMGGICPTAILISSWRINEKSISDDGYLLVTLVLLTIWTVWTGVRQLRRAAETDLLPRKHRLEMLLRDLEGQ